MIRTNRDKLVISSVMGMVSPPLRKSGYRVDHEGVPFLLPGVGGITYNVKVGDCAFGWAGDHIEPCVSAAAVTDSNRSDARNVGLNVLACVGNSAKVISGEAKGATGVVTGKHGGIEHVLIDFADEDLENMAVEDKILIKGYGQGLKLLDYPGISCFNLDPDVLEKMGIVEEDGRLLVPVAGRVPAKLMGSGLGTSDVGSGDYDITTADEREMEALGLSSLKFGDLVAIEDADNRYGRCYRRGALTIGVVVHSDCLLAGHGPGVTTLLTAVDGSLAVSDSSDANIASMLQIGRCR